MDAAVVGRPSEHCRARQSYHKPALHDMFVAMYYNVVLYYHLLRAPYGMAAALFAEAAICMYS